MMTKGCGVCLQGVQCGRFDVSINHLQFFTRVTFCGEILAKMTKPKKAEKQSEKKMSVVDKHPQSI